MNFLRRIFSKLDYFADAEKKIEKLKANRNSQALILLMQDIQKKTVSSRNEVVAVFIQKQERAVYQAALALAELRDPKAIKPVIECLRHQLSVSTDWLSPSPQIVAKFGSAAVEPLILLLNEKGDMIRDFAVSALGIIGDKRALEPLFKLWEHYLQYEGFPPTIVWALGNIGREREVVERLVYALLRSNNFDSKGQAEALFALSSGNFGKLAEDILLQVLNDKDIPSSGKSDVARALCVLGNSEGRDALLNSSNSIDFVFLGRFNDSGVTEKLTTYLDTHSHTEKDTGWVMAALGLAEQGDVRSVKPLIEALAISYFGILHAHPWYRYTVHDLVVQGLTKLGKPAIEELSKLGLQSSLDLEKTIAKIKDNLQEKPISTVSTPSNALPSMWPTVESTKSNPNHRLWRELQSKMSQLPVINEEKLSNTLQFYMSHGKHWVQQARTGKGTQEAMQDFAISIISAYETQYQVEVTCQLKESNEWPSVDKVDISIRFSTFITPLYIFRIASELYACLYFMLGD